MEQAAEGQKLSAEELDDLSIRCLVLPLYKQSLLVPNTIVAEVIDYRELEKAGQTPNWLLGMLSWRGKHVPVVSFERLLGHEVSLRGEEVRYIVCNSLSGNTRVPFIALQVHGIPHLTLVKNEMLAHDGKNQQREPAVLASLRLNEESVIVPNIDVIEKMLEHLGIVAG